MSISDPRGPRQNSARKPEYPFALIERLHALLLEAAIPVRPWYEDAAWKPAIWHMSSLQSLDERIAFSVYPCLVLWLRGALKRSVVGRIRNRDWDSRRRFLRVSSKRGTDLSRFVDPSLARLMDGWTRDRDPDEFTFIRPNGVPLCKGRSLCANYILSRIGSRWRRRTMNEVGFCSAYNFDCGDRLRYPMISCQYDAWRSRDALQKNQSLLEEIYRHHPLPGIPMAKRNLLRAPGQGVGDSGIDGTDR